MNKVATLDTPDAAGKTVPIVLMETVRVPSLIDQDAFRRWARSPHFPRRGRFSYLKGELWADVSMEQLFSHNRVKTRVNAVLDTLVEEEGLGCFFSDRALLSHPIGLSTEPDGIFVSWRALETGAIRLVEGAENGFVELEGTPDMVLEVVSSGSVRKDTQVLRDLYWQAGIAEYWLLDARSASPRFDILHRGGKRYVATRRRDGWINSTVFNRSFRFSQKPGRLGYPQYSLDVETVP